MNYQLQQVQVIKALEERGLDNIFTISRETSKSVLFQAKQTLKNGDCIISLSLNGGNLAPIYYCIGRLDNLHKKNDLLNLINAFNEENLVLNFFLHEDNTIMARITYISNEKNFNAYDYISLIEVGFKSIEDNYYDKIMDASK